MKLKHALALASSGLRIFPLAPNSRTPPKGLAWKDEATTDKAKVERWWEENPDYNVGVAAGDGLLIVDADCKNEKPGLDSLELLDMLGLPTSYRVRTPSGGVHVYLRSDAEHQNRVDSIPDYPGIDIRTDGGYVVGPGSIVDGKEYQGTGNLAAIDISPSWFDEHLQNTKGRHSPHSEHPLVELDRPEHIASAVQWLEESAPEAIEGSGGDETTYKVAARLRDFGLSPEKALDLMLEHWNEQKASPPWAADELETKVHNAFSYATGGWGAKTAAGEFGDVADEIGDVGTPPEASDSKGVDTNTGKKGITAKPYAFTDPASIPRREWLYGRHLARKFVSVTVAPGGVGKSSLVIAEALAMVSGKPLLGYAADPLRVWYLNLEDPYDELQRRFQAAIQHYGLTPEDIGDRLFVNSGRESPLRVAISDRNGVKVVRPAVDAFSGQMLDLGIDAAIVDPFISSHTVPENDNIGIDVVAKLWGKVADETNSAISLIHHTRKANGEEATVDSARGASALVSAARNVRVLNRMSTAEAEKAGIENHRRYFRVFSDKNSMAPPLDKSDWFKMESVLLANGDEVGVVTPWEWPDPFAEIGMEHVARVQSRLGERHWRLNVQAKGDWVGNLVADVIGTDLDTASGKDQVKRIVKEWISQGWLKTDSIKDAKGRERPVVVTGKVPQDALANEFK